MTGWGRSGDEPQQSGGYQGPPASGQFSPGPQYPPAPQYPVANPYTQVPPYGYGYPPGYPPGYPQGSGRPGTTIAAAVLGYVAGGLLIVAGIILFFGASFITNYDDLSGQTHSNYVAELSVNGVFNLIAAGLLIAGSVTMSGRNPNGRLMFSVGSGIVIIETIYWLARWASRTGGAVVVYGLLFAAIVIVGLALAWTTAVSAWLRGTG